MNLLKKNNYAFIDGSYNGSKRMYGYGGFVVDDSGNKHEFIGSGKCPKMRPMRNVAGEILAAYAATQKAKELGMKRLTIYYDYEGIANWATGAWKTNKKETKAYKEYMKKMMKEIKITFIHIKGHTGVEGNEEADKLAKKAIEEGGI